MTNRTSKFRLSGAAILTTVFALAGCDGLPKDGIFARHVSDENANAAAHRRWDDFRANVRLRMAEEHLNAGRLAESQAALDEARELAPGVVAVDRLSARLHIETGEFTRARDEIALYLAAVPNDAEAHAMAGRIAERSGDPDEAIKHYRRAIELSPDDSRNRLALAEVLAADGKRADALDALELATGFESSGNMRRLAMEICLAAGDRPAAARHARVLANLADSDSDTQMRAGLVLAEAGAAEDAIAVLRPHVRDAVAQTSSDDALKTDRNDSVPARVIHAYARSCLEAGRDPEAMHVLKAAIRRDATDEVSWSLYCRTALRSGDLELALDVVQTFNRRNKPIPEMLVLQAYVHFLRGEFQDSQDLADRAIEIDPTIEAAFLLKARAALDVERQRQSASEAFESATVSAISARDEWEGVTASPIAGADDGLFGATSPLFNVESEGEYAP